MARPDELPDWDPNETNLERPPNGLLEDGYALNTIPLSRHLNWWRRLLSRWTAHFDAEVANVGAAFSDESATDETLSSAIATVAGSVYGEGGGGAVVISGTETLTADVHATTFLVEAGAVLDTAGFEIRATVSIEIESGATVRNNGSDGTVNWGAGTPVYGGAGAPGGTLGGGGDGGQGVIWGSDPNDAVFQADDISSDGYAYAGGSGSDGVHRPTTTDGGEGFTVDVSALGGLGTLLSAMGAARSGATLAVIGGGGGGGGGSAGSLNASAANGSGGGGGGGVILLAAPAITNNGAVEARGGSSGDVVDSTTPSGDHGYPGGAGGGGVIIRVCRQISGAGTWSVARGNMGTRLGSAQTNNATDGRILTIRA